MIGNGRPRTVTFVTDQNGMIVQRDEADPISTKGGPRSLAISRGSSSADALLGYGVHHRMREIARAPALDSAKLHANGLQFDYRGARVQGRSATEQKMQKADFIPGNALETALAEAKQGKRPIGELLDLITESDLHLPSRRAVQEDGTDFEPFLLHERGNPMVAAYSSASRPGESGEAPAHVLRMKGSQFLPLLPIGYGILLNPGTSVELAILPPLVKDLKKALERAG